MINDPYSINVITGIIFGAVLLFATGLITKRVSVRIIATLVIGIIAAILREIWIASLTK